MSDLSDSRVTTDPAPQTDLESRLQTALLDGPQAIATQCRAALLLCAGYDAPQRKPSPNTNQTGSSAHLSALTRLADELDEDALADLYKAVQAIDRLDLRLLNSVRLALRLPPHLYQRIIRQAWAEVDQLESPLAQAEILLELTPLLTLSQDEPAATSGLLEIVAHAQAIKQGEAQIRSLTALVPHLPQSMRLRVLHRILDEIDQLSNSAQRAAALTAMATHMTPEIQARALQSAEAISDPAERARAFTALARYLPIALQTNLREDALTAISTIRSEEERSNALIAFAPHLEYVTEPDTFPRLLEHALAIAISIRRRHMRARVLVALAPHLTLDLQGEALAAVHSLVSERGRAMLLAQLAPALPSNMLIASLAVAHSMTEQDSRVHALATLAHYAPESARERTVQDALDTAMNLDNLYERVSALVNLADVLPPTLQDTAFNQALDAARMIDNENARARALSRLAAVLPSQYQAQAVEIALQLDNAEQRLTALSSLTQVMNEAERFAQAEHLLAAVAAVPYEYKRARAIAEIASLLPPEAVNVAIRLGEELDDPVDRITALTALIPHLDTARQREVTLRCWQLINDIDNGYDAASALVLLAPYLPESAARDLTRTASMIIGSIMDNYDQASAIAILAPLIAKSEDNAALSPLPDRHTALEKAVLALLRVDNQREALRLLDTAATLWVDMTDSDQSYVLWRTVIPQLIRLPLADAMLILSHLSPVIRQLAGDSGVSALAQIMAELRPESFAQSD